MALCYPEGVIDWGDPDDYVPTPEEVDLRPLAEMYAWTTLQVLTAYQIAICPITVRPCKADCAQGSYYIAPAAGGPGQAPFWPNVRNGQWTNIWCGHRGGCGCTEIRDLVLPGPVGLIDSVIIGGIELDPSAYRVDNGNRLVRQDGEGWPACQDFNLPAGEVGTFSVTYWHGAVADELVIFAAKTLAREWLLGLQGEECRLPSGTTNIVRQGMTIEIQANMFENGLTDINEVDSVILRFNPYRAKMPARIFSLDRTVARTSTFGG